MKKTIIASVLATTLLITSSVVNAAPITAKAPAPGFPLADGIDLDATSIESQVSDTEITAIAPAPGFPYADGIDLCADEPPITITSGDALYSRQHYSSSGFYTGVYVGGSSNPSTFELDNNGYAQFSSVSQESVNPGETVSITYQTIDAGNGNVLSSKSLSGAQSSATVTLTTAIQKNKTVNAYLRNYTGHETKASGYFNY